MEIIPAGAALGGAALPGAASRLARGAVLSSRFSVDEFLGTSAGYELYRATDITDDKPVWIKLLHRELVRDPERRTRLEQDLAVAAQLDHKNIARCHGFFADGDSLYMVSEAVEGSSLTEMLEKKRGTGRAFSLKGAYSVVAHVCSALEYAHGALVLGVLSTDTVLVNGAGRVKVGDLGLGRLLPSQERFRLQLGPAALACMAPEMAAPTGSADRRADVYSAGAVLFELLTGAIPGRLFERPSVLVPGLPPELDPVIERCLMADPAERFSDAHELKLALHAAVDPALARQSSAAAPPASKGAAPPSPPPSSGAGRPPPPPPPLSARTTEPRPSLDSRTTQPPTRARTATPAKTASRPGGSAFAAVDESQERWLIQKDKLDFGPFKLGEVRQQIEGGQILGDHTIVDMENGERRRVKDHPLLRDMVLQLEGRREEGRRVEAEATEVRRHKRRIVSLLAGIFGVILVGGSAAAYLVLVRGYGERIIYRDRYKERVAAEELLKGIEITMKVDPPAPKTKKHHGHPGQKNANGEFSDVTNLGDASEDGGDDTLGQDVVQHVMSQNFNVLKGCVLEEKHRDHALRSVDMDFVIRGTGQVSAVKVNGSTTSPFASCMLSKMQTVAFPRFNGSKTHASFSLALK